MTATVLKYPALRTCTKCSSEKPIEDFARYYSKKYPAGRTRVCKGCMRIYAKKKAKEFRTKNPRYHRPRNLKLFYGLTEADYHRMLAEQGGGCAACRRAPAHGELFCVDHEHTKESGRGIKHADDVRGILCTPCNRGLGFFRDNSTALRNAAEYLEAHQRRNAKK